MPEMKKLKIIACDVLNREVNWIAARSSCYTDTTFIHQGLHCVPDKLRITLQEEINKANEEGFPYNHFNNTPHYDYIVIMYGLCSNGIAGVSSSNIPLVIPRGHDCLTLLLGSKDAYQEYFNSNPGTYWYSRGWIERSTQPGRERYEGTLKEYEERYGEENAEYLMEMEQNWMREYQNAAFVNWETLGNTDFFRKYSEECAEYMKWRYSELQGDVGLMERLVNGVFDEKEVLIVPPLAKVVPSYDEGIIKYAFE